MSPKRAHCISDFLVGEQPKAKRKKRSAGEETTLPNITISAIVTT
jgi:hypothetical protein